MAEIRSYIREKEKRERGQKGYQVKILRHRLKSVYRVLLVAVAIAALVALGIMWYRQFLYTDYDVVSSVERDSAGGARDLRLGNAILTYSKDGAHCTDVRGNVKWNQTFEIQDVKLAMNGDAVAIGDYNGRNIYVANTEGILREIVTAMPVRNLAVSAAGDVTAVLADTNVTWVNTYTSGGAVFEGRTHMDDSGYPMAVSLSPNGELLCVSYVYVDAGVLKTNVAFYNFGEVGDNVSDFLISTYSYTDMLVPFVKFINRDTAFAVGDSRLMIYAGSYKPVSRAEHLYDREIQSVFYSDRYIGLVFYADNGENLYQLRVYDVEAADTQPKDFYFDMEYSDIFFANGTIVIYNETECQIMTVGGAEKFRGAFHKAVRLMLPVGSSYRYLLVTDNSIDTIQLK